MARIFAVFCALAGAALLVGPVVFHPFEVLGSYASEGPHHLARMAAHMQDDWNPWLFHAPREFPIAPRALNLSPATMVLMWPFWLAMPDVHGLALGWNAAWLLLFLAGAGGAWLLGRQLDDDPWVAAFLVSVVSSAAFLQDLPNVGRPETMILVAWPLHLGLLAAALKHGRAWIAGAALSFAFLAFQGGYPALFLGLAEPIVGLHLMRRLAWNRRGVAVIAVVALAGAVALAPWVVLAMEHPPAAIEVGRETLGGTPIRGLMPWGFASEVANWGVEPRTYLGAVLGLASLAALRFRWGRWAFPGVVAVLLLALGPDMRWQIDDDGVTGPAQLVHWLVPLAQPTIWARIGAILPILAGLAVIPLIRNRPAWALALGLGSFVEHTAVSTAWAPVSWPLDLDVAYDVPWVAPLGGRSACIGNAIPIPRGPHLAMRIQTLGWLDAQMPIDSNEPLIVRDGSTIGAPTAGCAQRDLYTLRGEGFTELIVLHGEFVTAEKTTELETVLGPGEPFAGGVLWDLPISTGDCDVPLMLRLKGAGEAPPEPPVDDSELPDRIRDRNDRQ